MGTNYYTLKRKHIGKRSAAGLYCWDCGITLCMKGEDGIHFSCNDEKWYNACPICGKTKEEESLGDSSAGRELGFNKKPFGRKSGVKSCSSFTWAAWPSKIGVRRKRNPLKFVKDEYGRRYSLEEFKKILEECPVQFWGMIGEEFS